MPAASTRTDREIFSDFLEKVSNIPNAHTNTDLVIAAAEAHDEMQSAAPAPDVEQILAEFFASMIRAIEKSELRFTDSLYARLDIAAAIARTKLLDGCPECGQIEADGEECGCNVPHVPRTRVAVAA